MKPPRVLEAAWTWIDGSFQTGVQIEIDEAGRISRCGELGIDTNRSLADRALLPGFVNAHSHAFQRGLRGEGERFPGATGSFWSWREAMYSLVERLDRESLYRLSRRAFDEMRAAGITAVGEFHYLHHHRVRELDFAFDDVVLTAARDSGLRTVLLEAYYRRGGVGRELTGAQRRFATPDPGGFWRQIDELTATLDDPRLSLGVVAHSIRAADPGEVAELHAEARGRGLVFHMHVEEQEREIIDCREAYGRGPLALMTERLAPGPEFTAIHCTHSTSEDVGRFAAGGGGICLCPLTEANLADGIPEFRQLGESDVGLSLGTDSNARISMLEEMRWLEYGQRLASGHRGVIVDSEGACASRLLDCATAGGAAALGLDAGRIAPGCWADFALIDLDHPSLGGWRPETLLDSLVFGGGDGAIAGSYVGGVSE